MLNRHKWDHVNFHRSLAALARVGSRDQVLDLGCGPGASLEPLLESVGEDGKVFALDRMKGTLAQVEARYAAAVGSGRLVVVQGDIGAPPFADGAFDAIVCQNVVECLPDRDALVAQATRVLKPGGTLLLGHHDFDGVIIANDDRELTRRLVHGFADYKQDWPEAVEGQMGRMIPGLVSNASFASVEIETAMFVDLDLDEGSYAGVYLGSLTAVAPAIGVSSDEMQRWTASLKKAASEGRFFFGLPWVAAICRKAEA